MKLNASMDDRMLAVALAAVILAGLVLGYAMTPKSLGPGSCKMPEQAPVAVSPGNATADDNAPAGETDEFGDDSEIGKPCDADSDCRLPMSYAIRSSCPFAVRCSEGSCKVYCPWNDSEAELGLILVDNTTAGQQQVTQNSSGNATLLLFWSIGCPHCAAEKEFLDGIREDYPELAMTSYEVSESDKNTDLLKRMCAEREISCDNTPITFVGRMAFKSYKGDEGALTRYAGEQSYLGYGSSIENAIRRELGLPAKEDPNAWRRDLRLSAATDKELYYEKEPINITAVVYTSANVTGCYLKARGIEHSGDYYVDESEMVNLKAGNNTVVLRGSAPLCFGCADFRPGDYRIDVWLERAGETLKEVTLTIEIRDSK